jgi:UDP-N-acetyl-2-amino-2-deoxyglucuronate dehydrogenase
VDAIDALGEAGKLVAVCDLNPEALAAFENNPEVQTFTSLDHMLGEGGLDVVSICTPSGMHADHGVQVAEAGLHVLVEKPMDVTLEAANRLVSACQEAGVQLFPIFQNRFNPTIQLVKQAIDLGRFGRMLAMTSTVIWERDQSYYDSDTWRGTRAMDGGALMNQGIHFLDAMRFLGGEVRMVQPMLKRLSRQMECEDSGSVLFEYESGALGNMFITMAGISDLEGSITLLGETGSVKLGGLAMNTIEHWEFETPHPQQDEQARSPQVGIDSVYGNGHRMVYQQVAAHLRGGDPYPLTPDDAVRSLELVLRCYQDTVSSA